MNMVWDCIYCERVNPYDEFSCLSCGAPRMKKSERYVTNAEFFSHPDYDSPYFKNGGASIRPTEKVHAVWL